MHVTGILDLLQPTCNSALCSARALLITSTVNRDFRSIAIALHYASDTCRPTSFAVAVAQLCMKAPVEFGSASNVVVELSGPQKQKQTQCECFEWSKASFEHCFLSRRRSGGTCRAREHRPSDGYSYSRRRAVFGQWRRSRSGRSGGRRTNNFAKKKKKKKKKTRSGPWRNKDWTICMIWWSWASTKRRQIF